MADDFAKEVRDLWTQAEEADRENCEEALIDLKFEAFDQWDEQVRNQRESGNPPLPCLTINTAQQFTGLIVGDWLSNETSIKLLPREDGDVKIADVRSELIRSIELQSKANRIYASSLGQAAGCGISNFRVDIDYAYEDAFERDIFINDIPNPLAVKWDPLANDPTGRDATYCFVGDEISRDEYTKRFPKAALPTLIQREAGSTWASGNTVTVPEYWRIEERQRTIGMTVDGKTVDLTDKPEGQWPQLAIDPETQKPIIRDDAKCKYAVMVLTNGMEQLTDPLELKLPRLPIIRVMGREVWTGEKRVRFGIIRCLRDSQRIRNYLRSLRAELLMRAPRANFTAPASSIKGREGDWPNTLVHNDGQAPTEITAKNLVALMSEEQIYAQDMMDTTGIHQASRGMPSNETSGRAILARQHEGDIATLIYSEHMTYAQQEAGEVINALIPTVYDTARTIRTVGPDMAVKQVRINDPTSDSIDLGIGKYDVVASTGPRYQSRRQQTTDFLMQLIQAKPDLAQVIGDIAMRSQDVPEADEMADRIKRTMDPNVLGADANEGKDPEELAAQQQEAQRAQQMKAEVESLQMRKATAETESAEAAARKAKAEAEAAERGIKLQIDGYNAETNRLKAITAKDFPLPAEAVAMLAPIVTQAIVQALASPDVLPPMHPEDADAIASGAAHDAIIEGIDQHINGAGQTAGEGIV